MLVPRDQRKPMLPGDRSNPEIVVRDRAAFGAEAILYLAKVHRSKFIACQDRGGIGKMLKSSLIVCNSL